ncbi:class I SAM-dependent methyltransferase [Cognatiluteimonas telluris]|jgi:2-polyprenyl-3-methyl-5-hydroxy-6-metoxy-1,4-benzoquinol methylase|uniref:class I SAM-dependent methyltransferase n=1 Tax=Cognatiluteimonas telluris TaxID=1104775 RepID=UPI0014074CCB|nr:class I SAM-dependent methyltransferase [Lysobacter telluris]
MSGLAAFDADTARRIARAFLPARRLGNRWNYHYSRIKLGSDPLYPGVAAALRDSRLPLLDLGCGIGLLAHALRAEGVALAYRGVDNDSKKIAQARQAARVAGLAEVQFAVADLASAFPAHQGSVAILDVLQYLDDGAQQRLLDAAIAMLVPGAKLVLRTGIEDGSGRMRVTRAFDRAANLLGWMNAAPRNYPRADALRDTLDRAGLRAGFASLRGKTPFNNWLVVATR